MITIPSNPKIKIKNFLCKLDNKIKIVDKNKYLVNLHKSLDMSYGKIAKELGISESFYRHCIQSKKNIPLWLLKLLLKFDNKLSDKYYNKSLCLTARNNIITLPKELTPKLAYFIGYLQGDGFVGSDKKTYAFSDEYSLHLDYINKINKELFGNSGYIRLKKSKLSKKYCPCLEIRQNVVNSYLHHVWELPRGFKTKLKVPKIFYKNKKILRWYLKGLFDADGTLPKNPKTVKQFFIDLTIKDKNFVSEIKKILELKFGIKVLKLYPRSSISPSSGKNCITWELRIRRHSEIRKFLKEVGFHHFEKKRRNVELLKFLPQ